MRTFGYAYDCKHLARVDARKGQEKGKPQQLVESFIRTRLCCFMDLVAHPVENGAIVLRSTTTPVRFCEMPQDERDKWGANADRKEQSYVFHYLDVPMTARMSRWPRLRFAAKLSMLPCVVHIPMRNAN